MLGMMASLDENVGRVLATLRETKLEDNTLIFFLSDNGGATGKPRLQQPGQGCPCGAMRMSRLPPSWPVVSPPTASFGPTPTDPP
jgi:arylsulfatase A-like enzyme